MNKMHIRKLKWKFESCGGYSSKKIYTFNFLVKNPSEFVCACCEFTKVILSPKSGINVCVKALIMVYNKTLLTFLKLWNSDK